MADNAPSGAYAQALRENAQLKATITRINAKVDKLNTRVLNVEDIAEPMAHEPDNNSAIEAMLARGPFGGQPFERHCPCFSERRGRTIEKYGHAKCPHCPEVFSADYYDPASRPEWTRKSVARANARLYQHSMEAHHAR